ncbi:MAG: hypothetical protein LAO76_14760 [Acidobacteriia bacterium]|nr:hypothetical protein [Terriglobia bacterium]
MDSLIKWPSNHPIVFTLILFVFSSLVSIYASEIKRFLRERPLKFKEYNQQQFARDLALLQRLHNDSYQLILFFLWNIVSIIYAAVLWTGIFFLLSFMTHNKIAAVPLSSAIIGVAFGKALLIRQLLTRLVNYEHSVIHLKKLAGIPESNVTSASSGN